MVEMPRESPALVTDEAFEAASQALANGERTAEEGPAEAASEELVVEEPVVEVEVEEPKSKAKAPKVRKALTVHKHWLIDIRRFSKELGIHEGQKLNGTVRTRKGKKILELAFL